MDLKISINNLENNTGYIQVALYKRVRYHSEGIVKWDIPISSLGNSSQTLGSILDSDLDKSTYIQITVSTHSSYARIDVESNLKLAEDQYCDATVSLPRDAKFINLRRNYDLNRDVNCFEFTVSKV